MLRHHVRIRIDPQLFLNFTNPSTHLADTEFTNTHTLTQFCQLAALKLPAGVRELAAVLTRMTCAVDSQIKREMRELRMRGVIRGNQDDVSKKCSRCCKKFVPLLNVARVCVQCSHRVCDKCCQQLPQKRWICCLCLKQL